MRNLIDLKNLAFIFLLFLFMTSTIFLKAIPIQPSYQTYSVQIISSKTPNSFPLNEEQLTILLMDLTRVDQQGDLLVSIEFEETLQVQYRVAKGRTYLGGYFYELMYSPAEYKVSVWDGQQLLWSKQYLQDHQTVIFPDQKVANKQILQEIWKEEGPSYMNQLAINSLNIQQVETDINSFLQQQSGTLSFSQKVAIPTEEVVNNSSIEGTEVISNDIRQESIDDKVTSTTIQQSSSTSTESSIKEETNEPASIFEESPIAESDREKEKNEPTSVLSETATETANVEKENEPTPVFNETATETADVEEENEPTPVFSETTTETSEIATETADVEEENEPTSVFSETSTDHDSPSYNPNDDTSIKVPVEPVKSVSRSRAGFTLGAGRMALNLSQGTIQTSIVDDSPSMDNFATTVNTEDQSDLTFFRLGYYFENLDTKRAGNLALDWGPGNGNAGKLEVEFTYGLLIGQGRLSVSPQLGVVVGNANIDLGEMRQNDLFIQIDETRFFSETVDISYRNLFAGPAGRLNVNYAITPKLSLNFFGGYTYGFSTGERIKFEGRDAEDSLINDHRTLPNRNTFFQLNNADQNIDKLFNFDGVKLGLGLIFNSDGTALGRSKK